MTILHEADTEQKISRLPCMFDNEPMPFHLGGERLQLGEHYPSDAFAPHLGRDHQIIDPYRFCLREVDSQDSDQPSEQFSDQGASRQSLIIHMGSEECAYLCPVAFFHWAHKQPLPTHDP